MVRVSELVLNFVLNSGWQAAVVFAIAALASLLLKNGPARYRHLLWVVALAACLIVPLLTASRLVSTWASSFQVLSPRTTDVVASAAEVVNQGGAEELNIDRTGASRRRTVTASTRSIVLLTIAYVLFVSLRGIRLVRFWRRKEKLRRSAICTGLAQEIGVIAHRCRKQLKIGHVPVAVSRETRVPYTLGTLRPLIVLPENFCSNAGEPRLLSVIGHEMAHVKRSDFLTNLICELVALPISFHPLTFLIKRQIDRERELACDELVTAHVVAAKVYARSLLWAAHVSRQYSPEVFMLSIFDGKILEERIVRVMRSNRRVGAGVARVMMLAALAVLSVSALSLSMFTLELQTDVRGAVTQTVERLELHATQEPTTPAVPASAARNEAQPNARTAEDRAIAACQAGRRGDVEAIPSLIAMLGDDTKIQSFICWDTGRWSPALQTFKQPSPGEQAAIALASFGPPAYGPLTQQLDSSNATVRRNAAWAIGELTRMLPSARSGAVPQLITLLGDSDEWVRMAAARALGELRDERALMRLIATLSDDQWRVRELATWALSEMKDERAVAPLCSVLLSDARVEVRRQAAEALGEIASAEALPALKQALNDPEARVSAKAAWAISEIEG